MPLTVKLSVAGIRKVKNRETGEMEEKETKGGTVCVYGLNAQFPVALYPNQWEELALAMPDILSFIKEKRDSGEIVDRVQTQTVKGSERRVLRSISPIVAELMRTKNLDEKAAHKLAKDQGLIR